MEHVAPARLPWILPRSSKRTQLKTTGNGCALNKQKDSNVLIIFAQVVSNWERQFTGSFMFAPRISRGAMCRIWWRRLNEAARTVQAWWRAQLFRKRLAARHKAAATSAGRDRVGGWGGEGRRRRGRIENGMMDEEPTTRVKLLRDLDACVRRSERERREGVS